jgi:hypothetical protein
MNHIKVKPAPPLETERGMKKRIFLPGYIRVTIIVFLCILLAASGYYWDELEYRQKFYD